jgi:hypothetical protein
MPIQSALARVGVAIQSVKGTLGANPTFTHGVTDGNVLSLDIDQEPDAITSGVARIAPHAKRTDSKPGAGFTTRAFSKAVGLWLYAVLGTKGVSGSGPYVHTFTGGTSLPRLSWWGELDGTKVAVRDVMVDEVELAWEGSQPLDVKVTVMGTVLSFPGTMVASTDDTTATYMIPAGGTFKLDTKSATAVTARIKAGNVKIKNNVEEVPQSASIEADDMFPGRQEYEVSLTLVPDDLAPWREVVTGATAGTSVSQTPIYGSFDIKFVNGADSLQLVSLRVPFLCDFPDADPDGGPVELELVGTPVLQTGGGVPLTVTLTNGQTTY